MYVGFYNSLIMYIVTVTHANAGLDIGDRMVAIGDCEFRFGDCEKKSVAKLATVKFSSIFLCNTVFCYEW